MTNLTMFLSVCLIYSDIFSKRIAIVFQEYRVTCITISRACYVAPDKRQDGMKCFPLRALAIKQETVTVTDSAGVPVVWDGNSSVS